MTTSIGDTLAQYKIIPVLVLEDLESGLRRCELLCECGLPVAEITFRTKAAESIIREASRRFPEMFIGAGTILNTADLHRAFDAGAKFAVAPGGGGRRQDAQVHCRALQTPRNQIHAYRRRHDRQCGGLACGSRSFRRGRHMAEQGGRRRHQKSRGSCKVPLMN